MDFLTNEKLTIIGAAGMIGSNMAQTAMMMRLTPHVCLYDPFATGLKGVAEEMYHCAFEGADITYTDDIREALTGAAYVVSSGGAPRKQDIKSYCPDVKHVVIIFNPADLTGLVTLLHSGLKPSQLTTLAALDSTRLQSALAQEFGVQQSKVTGCHTYGGHGEQMAVFASEAKIDGTPFTELLGNRLPLVKWDEIKQNVIQGGKKIIELRGRSSFQSPSYVSIEMIAAAMGGKPFTWPAGCYVNTPEYHNVMMAMPTVIDGTGVHYSEVKGTAEEMAALGASYEHLCKMRDEIIDLGIIPAVADWKTVNPNL